MKLRPGALSPRGSKDAGVTLVEYSLMFALIVIGSLGAFNYLSAQAEEQVDNQADCISSRPPPVECQTPAVPTSDPNPPPPTDPPPPAPEAVEAVFDDITMSCFPACPGGVPMANINVSVSDLSGDASANAKVWVSYYCPSSTLPFLVDGSPGTTDTNGEVTFDTALPCTGNVTFVVHKVITQEGAPVTTVSTQVTVT